METLRKISKKIADWLFQNMFYDEKNLEDVEKVSQLIPHGLAVASIEDTDFYINKDLLLRQIGYY
jgi:hypothetical protein